MSSSSTTACSRSPSPSPATPESTDGLDAVLNQDELSAWCNSLSPSGFLVTDRLQLSGAGKTDPTPVLDLEDILQDGVIENSVDALSFEAFSASESHSLSQLPAMSNLAPSSSSPLPCTSGSLSATRPIPPPPSQPRPDLSLTSQRVVFPPKETCYNLPIMTPSIPEGGTKSRVETQVRITVDLAHASVSSGEPFKYDRVGTWKWLRLPRGTSTKKRTRKEGKIDAPGEDTLYLTAEVTCSSSPYTRVTCCSSCQAREAKRVARKIAARVRPARSDTESQDEAPVIPGRGRHEDNSNIVQFNCPEILDFSTGSVILPLRITCYCRHHREKTGFNVHLKMLDHTGRIVGTGTTRPIMITDDHKTTGASVQKTQFGRGSELRQSPDWLADPVSDSMEIGLSAKRKKTRDENASGRTKKRTKPYDVGQSVGRTVRRDSGGSMDSHSNPLSVEGTRCSSPLQNMAHSPVSMRQPVDQASLVAMDGASAHAASPLPSTAFEYSSPVTDQMPQSIFDSDVTMAQQFDPETVSLQQLANTYLVPSPAPSSPIPLSLNPAETLTIPPSATSFLLFGQNPPLPMTGMPAPKIHRLIPSSGPTFGGIEVTVLGANFLPSMSLTCTFGGIPSSSTQRWSDNTLVCLLPPSATPGVVTVWFEGLQKEEDGTPLSVFTYTDETDKALMELALQVVGLKMTGKIEDARNVAMRIVGNTDTGPAENGSQSTNAMQLANAIGSPPDLRHLLLSRARHDGDFERVIIDFLSVLDVELDEPTHPLSLSISHQTASGQTLLHLAAMAKFPALMEFLITHEIDIDARDRNGCTALFLAAIVGSRDCAAVLVRAGAELDVVDARGRTPAEVAIPGFFDFMRSNSDFSERDVGEIDEEEAALGDVEEDSEDEAKGRMLAKRYAERRSTLKKRRSVPHPDKETMSEDHPAGHPPDSKNGVTTNIADEKQVASFMEMFSRTLAQWQHPQDIIANMQNLPLPHLPNLPAIPAWNALPQMPDVFPVLVPIPTLSALWGERRNDDKETETERDVHAQPRLAIPSAQDWRAFWEKWMTQAILPARTTDEISDAPPAYSPRESDSGVASASYSTKETEAIATSSVASQVFDQSVSRRVGYQTQLLPDEEMKAYTYRPIHKPQRERKKHDRMLVMFWIPILLIGATWALFHFMRMAFHATRAVLTIKAGLKV